MDPNDVAAARRALNAVQSEWMGRPGVNLVEVADLRGRPSEPTRLGIRVVLEPGGPLTGEDFPSELEGFPVQVRSGGAFAPESAL